MQRDVVDGRGGGQPRPCRQHPSQALRWNKCSYSSVDYSTMCKSILLTRQIHTILATFYLKGFYRCLKEISVKGGRLQEMPLQLKVRRTNATQATGEVERSAYIRFIRLCCRVL